MPTGFNNNMLYSAKRIIVELEKIKKENENDEIPQKIFGTGFFVHKNKETVFVTNRHMVEPGYKNNEFKDYKVKSFSIEIFESIEDIENNKSFKIISINNFNDFKFGDNYNDDVACLFNIKLNQLEDAKIIQSIPYDLIADENWINSKMVICDKIAYPGFPNHYNKLTHSPIFRMGTIASDPRFDYNGVDDKTVSKRICYEGFSFGGSSGSPVFSVQKGFPLGAGLTSSGPNFLVEIKMIGINAGHYNEISNSVWKYEEKLI